MKKKLLSILVVLAMVIAMMPMMTMTVLAEAQQIGESDTTWELSPDNTVLTIGGTGAMPNYNSADQRPWNSAKSSITTVVIEPGVTTIGGQAFYECSSLNEITIPTSITSIGGNAFLRCSALTKLTIPENVKNIGYNAFGECSNLVSLTVKATTPPIIDDLPFGDPPANLKVYVPLESIEAYKNDTSGRFTWKNLANRIKPTATKPNGAEWIVENETWYQLTEGNTVLTIGGIGDMPDFGYSNRSPWYAKKETITTAIIESGVTSIGNHSFFECNKLTSITIPDSVATIGECAFNSCTALKSITIPSSVTLIKNSAFEYCSSLEIVNVKATNPPTLSVGAFYNCVKLSNIYVPASSVDAYRGASEWQYYASKIQEIPIYKVTFNMNGHGTQVPVQNVDMGDKVIKPENPTADGWVFAGWFADEKCTDGNKYDFSTPVTEDTTLYAKWNEKVSPEPDTPKTGDDNNMIAWAMMLVLGLIGFVSTIIYKTKKQK